MWYTIIGRIPFDDEDSLYSFETDSEQEAVEWFRESILDEGEATEIEDGRPVVYINWVISSKSEPHVSYWGN